MNNPKEMAVEFSLENDITEIRQLAIQVEQISEKLNLNKADTHDINLVLEEWFTNLILYGKIGRRKSKIVIRIEMTDYKILLTVIDEGKYFDPLSFKLPELKRDLDQRQPGGLGLHLIFKLMDNLSYRREKDKNILQLEKYRSI